MSEPVENKTSKKISKKAASKKNNSKKRANKKTVAVKRGTPTSNYPRHSVEKAIRIPKAILEQNAGKECTDSESAAFVGVKVTGPYGVEVSSSLKYGFLERTSPGKIKPTELVKKILRPQSSEDVLSGYQEAVLKAPVISEVYKHFRGENIPDRVFFENVLTDSYKIPSEKVAEFIDIFIESLTSAKLIENNGGKNRILDISSEQSKAFVDSSTEI